MMQRPSFGDLLNFPIAIRLRVSCQPQLLATSVTIPLTANGHARAAQQARCQSVPRCICVMASDGILATLIARSRLLFAERPEATPKSLRERLQDAP